MAKRNVEKLLSFEQQAIRNLILFDRGYPSADFMLYLQEKGISYLMRAQGSFYKEIRNTTTPDEVVSIEITKVEGGTFDRRDRSLTHECQCERA